jgi:hypothetical protein
MSEKISLKALERSLYRDSIQDGIIDIQIGCVLSMLAIAPLLSKTLGDFWSSMVFLPFFAVIFLGLKAIRKNHIQPRIGKVKYGSYRKKLIKRLNWIILVFNVIALGLGILSFFQFSNLPDWIPTTWLSILLLIGFSLTGYMLELPRFYLYGILVPLAPLIGEYLYQTAGASHHGFPITFGITSAGLILTGLIILFRIMQKYPKPAQEDLHE